MQEEKRVIKLSPSSVEDFERVSSCKEKWRATRLDKEFRTEPTDAMYMGLLFESIVMDDKDLVKYYDPFVTSKTNKKRIYDQAALCRRYFDPEDELFTGWHIKNFQVKLTNGLDRGIADILAVDDEGVWAIIDLKFTQNLTNSHGYKNWLNLSRKDVLQLSAYKDWFMIDYPERGEPLMFYLVFDYSTSTNKRLIEVDLSKTTIDEMKERFKAVREEVESYLEDGSFPVNPSPENCGNCEVDCPFRFNDTHLPYERVVL